MGRRSLAGERREQCLDAFEAVIVERGFASATLEATAERAGVHRTLIRHYFGGRDALVAALLERMHRRYEERYRPAREDVDPGRRLERLLDAMFAPYTDGPAMIDRVFDALYATGTSDPRVAAFLAEFYRDASRGIVAMVRARHPGAPASRVQDVAAGILGLAVGHSVLETIEASRARGRRLRRSAEALLATLADAPR